MYKGRIIDCDVHHVWGSDAELIQYLPARWRDFFSSKEGRSVPLLPSRNLYPAQQGGGLRLDAYPKSGGLPGTDYPTMRTQLLDAFKVDVAVLGFNVGFQVDHLNPYLAAAMARASNDWSIERWIQGTSDPRLYTAMMVSTHLPDEAAAEIRRSGVHPGVSHVLLSSNSLSQPLGHPIYHPIYAAAEEMLLPIAIHVSAGEINYGAAQAVAGGIPSFRFEFTALTHQPTIHHVASMLTHGVFEKFPGLKLIIMETGVAWIPWLLWNLDRHVDLLRIESDWIKRLPSEYFTEHVKVTTQPLERTERVIQLLELLRTVDGIEDILCYSSDYPHFDFDDPRYIASRFPKSWHPKVFYENARACLRLLKSPQTTDMPLVEAQA